MVAAALDNPVAVDSISKLPIAPRELRVRFTVHNRGSEASQPRRAVLRWSGEWVEAEGVSDTVEFGPLWPGDSVTLTAALHIDTPYLAYGDAPVPVAVLVSVETPTGGHDDYAANDSLATSLMQLGLPFVGFAVEPIGRKHLQVNEQFRVRYRVWNAGFVEPIIGVSGVICLWHAFDPCLGRNFAVFGKQVLPPIQPGDTIVVDYPTAVAPAAAWQDEADDYWYSVCVQSSSWQDPYLPTRSAIHCLGPEPSEAAWVRVHPDYHGVCAPPVLAPGSSSTLRYNCGFMPYTTTEPQDHYCKAIDYFRFHLTALDAVAGVSYRVQPGPSYSYDALGERVTSLAKGDTLRFAVSGRYYLESFGADTLTFTTWRY